MAYTARKLITRAFYLSGIVARDFQTPTGFQITEGLQLLNDVLAGKRSQERLIPYFSEYNFNAVAGQEKYFIPNLALIETFTFNLNNVRYSMRRDKRGVYFSSPRVEDITTLPYSWHVERTKGGSDLYVYFIPDQNYPMTIWGKFALESVPTVDEDLELVYDFDYLDYLRFKLASYVCMEYGISLTPAIKKQLDSLESTLTDDSPLDLQMKKRSTLSGRNYLNYAEINLGQGWSPGGGW